MHDEQLQSMYLTKIQTFSGCLLRDSQQHMGQKWFANPRTSHDLHPVQLLQLNGRRRSLSLADMRDEITTGSLSNHGYRQVMTLAKF